jgi:hypothetical protein
VPGRRRRRTDEGAEKAVPAAVLAAAVRDCRHGDAALFLLGASFFSLSYNYARSQKSEELGEKAQMVAKIAAGYLRTGQEDDLRQLATFAATVSEVDFLICDTEGHVGLSTDPAMEGLVVTVPEEMTREVLEEHISASRSDLNGFYEAKRFIVGVPIYTGDTGEPAGIAFAVSTSASLDSMWQGLSGCSS